MLVYKLLYWAGLLAEIIIRAPYQKGWRSTPKSREAIESQERPLLGLLAFGSYLLPLVYSITRWLRFADYHLPAWMGWLGVAFLAASLFIFWRAHRDLRSNWSPTLEIYQGHTLITSGIYGSVRHPMYLSQWLMAAAQALLIQNWIAGLAGLIVFIPFYLLRARAEERMMEATFGEEYRAYMQKTGRVLPRF